MKKLLLASILLLPTFSQAAPIILTNQVSPAVLSPATNLSVATSQLYQGWCAASTSGVQTNRIELLVKPVSSTKTQADFDVTIIQGGNIASALAQKVVNIDGTAGYVSGRTVLDKAFNGRFTVIVKKRDNTQLSSLNISVSCKNFKLNTTNVETTTSTLQRLQ